MGGNLEEGIVTISGRKYAYCRTYRFDANRISGNNHVCVPARLIHFFLNNFYTPIFFFHLLYSSPSGCLIFNNTTIKMFYMTYYYSSIYDIVTK